MVDAIAAAGDVETLAMAVKMREARRADLRRQLRALQAPALDGKALRLELERRVADWRGLLSRQLPQARQLVRALLTAPLVFTPHRTARKRHYEFTLEARWLDWSVQIRWRPHRDSGKVASRIRWDRRVDGPT